MAEENRPHDTSNNTSQDQDKLLEVLKKALRRKHSKKNRIPRTFLGNGNINLNFLRSEDTPLTLVARHPSHIDILEMLIEIEGIDMDIGDNKGRTALSYACELHEVRYVKVLLLNKAHPNLQDQEGRTPLSWAATPTGKGNSFSEILKLLLKHGANANKEDLQGWIPLMWAVSKGSDVIVAELLSFDTGNIDHQDTQGRTPLSLAAKFQYPKIVELLLRVGANPSIEDNDMEVTLTRAIRTQQTNTVEKILAVPHAGINHRIRGGVSPLTLAVKLGLTQIAELLLRSEADVHAEDEDGYTPLGWAVIKGQKAIVGLLVSFGADLEYKHRKHDCCTALLLATKHKQIAVVDELLQRNAEVNCADVHGYTPLAWAARQGFDEIVKRLSAERDINIDTKDINEQTPLSLVARYGRSQIVRYLIQQQADINSKDREGQTPLAWAIRQSQDSTVVELLCNETIDLENHDVNDDSPLFLAAKTNNSFLMHIIMKAGANAMRLVNGHTCFWWLVKARFEMKNKPESFVPGRRLNPLQMLEIVPYHSDPDRLENNRTLLSWSAEYGDYAMVQALLEHGANPDIRDGPPINAQIHSIETKRIDASSSFSKTPLLWALINGHLAVVDMLKEKDSSSLHLLIKERELLGEPEALKLVCELLKTAYDINKLDSEGRCTLHLLSNVQDTKFAKALLDAKDVEVSLNLQDNSGKTSLYYALKEKNEAFARMLLKKGADTSNISAEAWFYLSNEATRWIEFTRQDSGSISLCLHPSVGVNGVDRLKKIKTKLCLFRRGDPTWSRKGPRLASQMIRYYYFCRGHSKQKSLSFEPSESHISVCFPADKIDIESNSHRASFSGIEWNKESSANGDFYTFRSTLSDSRIPQTPAELCSTFIDHLGQEWNGICTGAMETIETTRRDQLLRQGQGQKIIQILAQNGVKRAELQRALRQHVENLRRAIDEDTTIFPEQKKQLQAQVNKFDKSVNAKVLGIERAVRELLQIEFAWISISEAASIKRLSWITFIFLPLMFVSSLFGMNVNLLDDNPDWRWYLVLGGASLLFTVIMWTLFKFVPIESWLEAKWLLFRRPRNAHVGSKV